MALSLRFPLCFLSFVILLLIMNGHGCSGRDMKEPPQEKAEEKQVNQPYIATYEAKPVSKGEDPHSGYKAAYTSHKKHDHPSHQEGKPDSHRPYITAYRTSSASDQPYITSYGDKPISKDPYLGYRSAYTSKKPISIDPYLGYRAAYTSKKPVSVDPYLGYGAAYTSKKPVSIDPYLGYGAAYTSKKPVSIDPYLGYRAAYTSKKPISIDPYLGYRAAYTSKKHTQPSHQSYLTAYLTSQKDQKEMNEPYITQYGGKTNKDSKDSYAASYRKIGQDLEGSSSKVDHREAFETGFFSLDDLYVGNIMTLQFHVEDSPHFLPRKEADTIPFSMSQLPSVLQLFSINEDSAEGQAMKDTHEQCEAPTLTGETKVCATSLESMLEFVRTILGTDSSYDIFTTSYPTASSAPLQNYTVLRVSEDIYAPKWVACHPLPYPYAVFFCHYIGTGSKIFKVLLGAEDGNKMEALGICHLDTSEWTPEHVIFRQLGTRPGESPICHFFPVKHLMWVPLPSKTTM